MNVLLLSDFSRVAINATHYGMDLLQDHQVHFYLLNIYDREENMESKKAITLATLDERVQKLQQRAGDRSHKVTGHYSEDTLVNTARKFVDDHKIDLIVMGAVGHQERHSTILGKHTFEIMFKIKCNILAVPYESKFRKAEKLLMPLDYTASFGRKNIRFLENSGIFKGATLNIQKISGTDDAGDDREVAKKEIFSDLNNVKVKFSRLLESSIYDKNVWAKVQTKFDHVVLLGKNIRICDGLLHNKHGLYNSVPNQLPILVLHD